MDRAKKIDCGASGEAVFGEMIPPHLLRTKKSLVKRGTTGGFLPVGMLFSYPNSNAHQVALVEGGQS